MIPLETLLAKLSALNIKLWADGGNLHCQAPDGKLSEELRSELTTRKQEILAFLEQINTASPARSIIKSVESTEFALSFSQQRLWFIDQFEGPNPVFNMPAAIRIKGPLKIKTLEKSLSEIFFRHQVLRTRFSLSDGEPVVKINPAEQIKLTTIAFDQFSSTQVPREIQRTAQKEAMRPFNLATGPLVRIKLLIDTTGKTKEHILLFTIHHTIFDGYSIPIFLTELTALYEVYAQKKSSPLPELPIQYHDFAIWQRKQLKDKTRRKLLSYWRDKLAGLPPLLELPTDHPRPAAMTHKGACQHFILDTGLGQNLHRLAEKSETTLFMVLLASFAILLSRYSVRDDIVIGSPMAGRGQHNLEILMGLFVNTLPLRLDLSGNSTFVELLKQAKITVLEAYTHGELPFEQIVKAVKSKQTPSFSPIFQTAISLQNSISMERHTSDLRFELEEVPIPVAHYDLFLVLEKTHDGALKGGVEFNTDLFDKSTIKRLTGHFQILLRGICDNPRQQISQLPLLSPGERSQLVNGFNPPQTPYPSGKSVHEIFAAQAVSTPNQIAVVSDREVLTYGQLNTKANRLAHYLIKQGVGKEVGVGILLDRSPEMMVSLLGILKAGGVYVPLEPGFPHERLGYIIKDSGIRYLITHSSFQAKIKTQQAKIQKITRIDTDWPLISTQPSVDPASGATADNLASLMYTSGSTGRPKGVAVPHRGIVRLVKDNDYAIFTPDEVFLQFAPLSFDASTFEIWGALLNGARLAVMPIGTPSLAELGSALGNYKITTLWLTADLFHIMVEERLEDLKTLHQLLAGGDVLSPSHVRKFLKNAPGVLLINGYGPTENTTFTCCHPMGSDTSPKGMVPIGRPINGTRAYILDHHLEPVPIGVPGLLYIGGDGLAKGYHNKPELTARRFIADPFDTKGSGRIYNTGDLARYLSCGTIEFMGRLDHQIKFHGFRIEPEEIESVLNDHPAVQCSIVKPWQPAEGDKQLIAYVTIIPGVYLSISDSKSKTRDLKERIKKYLRSILPGYMVPFGMIFLKTMPRTLSGKIDHNALPCPDNAVYNQKTDMSGMSQTEELLVGIWCELLKTDDILWDGNFFELGGHSLLAIRLVSHIQDVFHVDLPVRKIFSSPTITALGAYIDSARQTHKYFAPRINPVPRGPGMPLSFAQERLWFLTELGGRNTFYNITAAIRLKGHLFQEALTLSMNKIIQRHESLRTNFTCQKGLPYQLIHPSLTIGIPQIDLTHIPCSQQSAEVARLISQEEQRPFDLLETPLIRMVLLQLDTGKNTSLDSGENTHNKESQILLLTMHHIISDGWSMALFAKELSLLYAGEVKKETPSLPSIKVQYADFALWQRRWLSGQILEKRLDYWRDQLSGVPPLLNLPTDRLRPGTQGFQSANEHFVINGRLTRQLEKLCQNCKVTPFMGLLGIFQILLCRYSDQEDICVGSPMAGRNHKKIENLIGFFINTLVLRADLGGNPTLRQFLERIRETALAAYENQDIPFEQIVEELQPERCLSHPPLFQVMFVLQDGPVQLELPGIESSLLNTSYTSMEYDLILTIEKKESMFFATLAYNTDLFDQTTIKRMGSHYQTLLKGATSNPDHPIWCLPLLTKNEKQMFPEKWNILQTANMRQGLSTLDPSDSPFYILDRYDNLQPLGIPGEICITKPQIHRTGERARYLPDGQIEFLGPVDRQIEIHGFKLDPFVIESILNGHPAIRESVIIARQASSSWDHSLMAYIKLWEKPISRHMELKEQLLENLKEKLPGYMIPDLITFLDEIPITPQGKIDLTRLPEPCEPKHPPKALPNPLEELLMGIWMEVLDRKTIEIDENFFELGGHSLMAAQVMARIRKAFGVELPLGSLFEAPTISGLAKILTRNIARVPSEITKIQNQLDNMSPKEIHIMLNKKKDQLT